MCWIFFRKNYSKKTKFSKRKNIFQNSVIIIIAHTHTHTHWSIHLWDIFLRKEEKQNFEIFSSSFLIAGEENLFYILQIEFISIQWSKIDLCSKDSGDVYCFAWTNRTKQTKRERYAMEKEKDGRHGVGETKKNKTKSGRRRR
mgnify:CR=1 FL=1